LSAIGFDSLPLSVTPQPGPMMDRINDAAIS